MTVTSAAVPTGAKTVTYVLATLLVALPAMILVYRWVFGG